MGETRRTAGQDTRAIRARLLAATSLAERRRTLAGVDTTVLEGGHGPTLVLLHGQGEYWGVWLAVLDDLARDHHVVVVDLPGHGDSGVPADRLDATAVVAWVDGLLDTVDDPAPTLVGHLLGGAIAARHAVRHPSRVGHLVLVDSLGLAWFRPMPRFAVPMVRFMARPTARSRDRLFRECFVDFDQTGDNFGDRWEDLRDYALACAQSPTTQAALRALMPRVGMPPIPREELAHLSVPTTLIHGRHDRQVRLAVAEAAHDRFGWPLHVIEGAADDPAAEQPGAFVAALRNALATTTHEGAGR